MQGLKKQIQEQLNKRNYLIFHTMDPVVFVK